MNQAQQKKSNTDGVCKQLRAYLEKVSIQLNGYAYEITPENEKVVDIVLAYFAQSPHFYDLLPAGDLDKGLLITGGYGTGKTALMRILERVCIRQNNSFNFVSAINLAQTYAISGHRGLLKYKRDHWLFDDVGEEKSTKNFGNEENVMQILLSERYNRFCTDQCVTHLTTNLNPAGLEARYGKRIYSRLYEMFNVLPLDGKDYRKHPVPKKKGFKTQQQGQKVLTPEEINTLDQAAVELAYQQFLAGKKIGIPLRYLYEDFAVLIQETGQYPQAQIETAAKAKYDLLQKRMEHKAAFVTVGCYEAERDALCGLGDLVKEGAVLWYFGFLRDLGVACIPMS